jgi:hypothetical protein
MRPQAHPTPHWALAHKMAPAALRAHGRHRGQQPNKEGCPPGGSQSSTIQHRPGPNAVQGSPLDLDGKPVRQAAGGPLRTTLTWFFACIRAWEGTSRMVGLQRGPLKIQLPTIPSHPSLPSSWIQAWKKSVHCHTGCSSQDQRRRRPRPPARQNSQPRLRPQQVDPARGPDGRTPTPIPSLLITRKGFMENAAAEGRGRDARHHLVRDGLGG